MKLALLAFSPLSRLACRTKDVLYKRGLLKARKAPLPTVSVGNLSFGGTEKTPLAMEIIAHLVRMGHRPAFVSRGYRGSWERKGGILSDGSTLLGTWEDGGDEPFMVARRFPKAGVFVGKDRLASCLKARELGFTAVVLDDAFQHRRLARDLDIVLVNNTERRPLREGPAALARADVILARWRDGLPDIAAARVSFPKASAFSYKVVPRAFIEPGANGREHPPAFLEGQPVFAFCGIAGPQRFLATLKALGADVAGSLFFPDHYRYSPESLKKIRDAYGDSGARILITTEKDIWKLRQYGRSGEEFLDLPVMFLRIGLDIDPGFYKRFEAAIGPAAAAPKGPE